MDRPNFAKDYPDDPELLALVDDFEAGNYRAVREGTAKLIADSDKNEELRAAARDLRTRTEPHRAQVWLLVLTAALVLALSAYEIARHAQRPTSPVLQAPAAERIH